MAKEEKKEVRVIPVYFRKDNSLISSKSRMTLLGRKIFDAAVMNVELGKSKNGLPIIKSELSGQELKEFIGKDYGSLYDEIKELIAPKPTKGEKALAPSLLDWKIIIKDDENKSIIGRNVITDAEFENGRMTLVFNNELQKNLLGIKNNYTMLNRSIISRFSSNYSYQLYQMFKQTIDYQTAVTNEVGPFELKMDTVDLKVQLGVVEAAENDILYRAVTDDSVITYDAIEGIEDKKYLKKLREYGNFRIYAIEKAKKEINEISDIHMEYKPMKRGKGGRKVGFIFTIQYKDIAETKHEADVIKEDKTIDIFEFIDEMRKFIKDERIGVKDLKSIAVEANYDMNKIKQVYQAMEAVQGGVDNPTGYMIKGIRDDYKPPINKKPKNSFNDFEQNTYDFDEFERKLLDN